MDQSPFHPGELQSQLLAGGGAPGGGIRDHMPDQHRTFFAMLPFMALALKDGEGWPVASIMAGPPGFVTSPDPQTLQIAARPDLSQPMLPPLRAGAAIGLLGIDLATRRRNRANGLVAAVDENGFTVAVQQSFGNCPQYIQAREVESRPAQPLPPEAFEGLDAQARAVIAAADTFFVASSSGRLDGPTGGLDISHRGGRPGFVRVDGETLTIPDFRGNRYFNTLGNLLVEPRAALVFVDFERGDLLQLQGRAEILWEPQEAGPFPGAERFWRFHAVRGWHLPGALPLRWQFREYAPTTQRTGTWSER